MRFSATATFSDSSTPQPSFVWTATGGNVDGSGGYTAGVVGGNYRVIAVTWNGVADTATVTVLVLIAPGQSIQAAVNANPAGTTVHIRAGRHVRQSVVPKNGNTFRCESGAILDGETVTPHAFRRSGGDPDDVRIVGCVIERYAPAPQMGAILAGGHSATDLTSGWIVDSTEVRNNANVGIRLGHRMKVRWSHIHHNSQLGIGGHGDDILIEGNEIAYNNPDTLGNLNFEAGGTKFVLTNRLVVRNNFVHHNIGPGLWADFDNDATLIEGNQVEDNLREGIVTEISYSAIIRNNTVRRNGLGDSRSDNWLWGAGIGVHATSDVEIYGNMLEGNAHGITLLQQARGSGRLGPYLVQNIWVHDNTITQTNLPRTARDLSVAAGVATDIVGDTAVFTSRNNRYSNNTYYLGRNPYPFHWQFGVRTEAQWKAYGHDLGGVFNH